MSFARNNPFQLSDVAQVKSMTLRGERLPARSSTRQDSITTDSAKKRFRLSKIHSVSESDFIEIIVVTSVLLGPVFWRLGREWPSLHKNATRSSHRIGR